MHGKNTMILNQATMKAAVQHYLDTVLFLPEKSPTVERIESKGTDGMSFIVEVTDSQNGHLS